MSWYFRHFLTVALMLTLSLLSISPALARTTQEGKPNLDLSFTVLVYNNAQVSPKILTKAADQAKKIFRSSGLEMVWVHFVPDQPISQEMLDRVDCVVRILPQARSMLNQSATGEALPCTLGEVACFANVFFDRVKDKASLGALSQDGLLAHAIAHELGHHLLGSDSHFSVGIMRPSWGSEDMRRMAKGDLLFRPEQATLMKANLLGRLK